MSFADVEVGVAVTDVVGVVVAEVVDVASFVVGCSDIAYSVAASVVVAGARLAFELGVAAGSFVVVSETGSVILRNTKLYLSLKAKKTRKSHAYINKKRRKTNARDNKKHGMAHS